MSTLGTTSTRRVLTVRRARVMLLTGRGWEEAEIAAEMRLSIRTVQRYKYQERNGIAPRAYPPGFGDNGPRSRDPRGWFLPNP